MAGQATFIYNVDTLYAQTAQARVARALSSLHNLNKQDNLPRSKLIVGDDPLPIMRYNILRLLSGAATGTYNVTNVRDVLDSRLGMNMK